MVELTLSAVYETTHFCAFAERSIGGETVQEGRYPVLSRGDPLRGMRGLQSLIWIGDAGSESGMTELLINDNLERPFWKDSGAQIKKPPS